MNKKFQKISGNLGVLKNLLFSLLAILTFSTITSCGQLGVPVAGGGAGGDEGTVTADFSIEYDNKSTTATIYDSSESSDGSALTYAWLIDDNEEEITLEDGTAEFDFGKKGNHTVELTVSSAKLKAEDTMSLTVDTRKNPTPIAAYNVKVAGKKATFTNMSKISGNGELSYKWSMDNKTITLTNNTYTFQDNGTYRVTLTATGVYAKQSHSATNDVVVGAASVTKKYPIANFTSTAVGRTIQLTNSSTIADNATLVYLWELDGKTFTSKDMSYKFESDGTKPIKLTASRAEDQTYSNTIEKSVVIDTSGVVTKYPTPIPAFEVATVGLKATFTNKTTVSDNAALSYLWEVDGTTAKTKDFEYSYLSGGQKTVKLTATRVDNASVSDSISKDITIDAPTKDVPTDLSISRGKVVDMKVTFTASAKVADGAELIYTWAADGEEFVGKKWEFQFKSAGSKTVNLTVSRADDPAISATTKTTLKIEASKKPIAAMRTVAFGRQVTFMNNSIVPDGGEVTLKWLVEGRTYTETQFAHTFASGGKKSITLTVTRVDDPSIFGTTINEIDIDGDTGPCRTPEKVDFEYSVYGPYVTFKSTSWGVDGVGVVHHWTMEGETVPSAENYYHAFKTPGSKPVTLVAEIWQQPGCKTSLTKYVNINSMTYPTVPTAEFSIAVNGLTMAFTNNSTISDGSSLKYEWNIDGVKSTLANPAAVTFAAEGYRTITLTAIRADGKVQNTMERKIFLYRNTAIKPLLVEFKITRHDNNYIVVNDITDVDNWENYDYKTVIGPVSSDSARMDEHLEPNREYVISSTLTDMRKNGKTGHVIRRVIIK